MHRLGTKKPKNYQKNPPDKKIGFMYKRTEKVKKQRAEKKMKLFIQVLNLNTLEKDIEENQK